MPERPSLLIRRVISLGNREDDLCVGWIEDNFHHFGVSVRHHGGLVTQVSSRVVRFPWTTCAETGRPLQELVGTPLRRRSADLSAQHAIRQQCTHLFELAALVLAQAAAAREDRRYDAQVWPSEADRSLCGMLSINGRVSDRWSVADRRVIEPAALAGHSLVTGFREKLLTLPDEEAERSWIMRRAFWLAEADIGFVRVQRANEAGLGPVCYTFQAKHACRAVAMPNSRIDANASDATFLAFASEIP